MATFDYQFMKYAISLSNNINHKNSLLELFWEARDKREAFLNHLRYWDKLDAYITVTKDVEKKIVKWLLRVFNCSC